MKQLVAIRHELKSSENIVVVDWGVSDVCNYRCSYCPPDTNRGTYPFYPVDEILGFAERIVTHYKKTLGKEVYFIFTGGEVTLFKDFIPLIKALKASGNRTGISSNGSREVSFWESARDYLEHVSLSFHAENTDTDHLIEVINTIKDKPYTHVNIMVKPDDFQRCIDTAYRIFDETDNITMDLQILLKDFIEPYPYTDGQRETIKKVSADINSRLKLKREMLAYRGRGYMRLVYDDGSEKLIKGAEIMAGNLHALQGWNCDIGLELLVIDTRGNIRRSWCGQGGIIGNVGDAGFSFPDEPYVCGNPWCTGGITDLMTTKSRRLP